MRRTRSLVMAAVVLGAALVPGAVAGAAQPDKADRADKAKAEHERIVAYWTPERMKAAKPRDFEKQPDGSFRQVATPKGKPGGGSKDKPGRGGGGDATPIFPADGSSTGKPWNADGAEVDKRTGKVYFTSGTSGYVCSGAVVDDGTSDRALVLTAAHCVYDNERKSRKRPPAGFVSNWLFVPDYSEVSSFLRGCAETTQGCWTAEALVVHGGFARAGGFNATATRYDFGFAVVAGSSELDAIQGWYGIDTDAPDGPTVGDTLSAFGYPAADPYDGHALTYCQGPIGTDGRNSNATWSMSCDMTGGSSGGPWLNGMDTSGTGGVLSSVNSYGYAGEPYMYGPIFNGATKAAWDTAKSLAKSSAPSDAVVG